ncbi:MAG: dTDP-4-dehydrorhamnose 3,5-epimerase family protein, partial [Gemmatimonadales bacterium]
DVAVDIRRGSPTFGNWVAAELTAENRRMLWVPPGFAHGFCTLTAVSEVVYKTTAEYSAAHDRGVRWNDPAIGVKWPTATPILSPKDAQAPALADADNTFEWQRAR